MSTNKFQLQKKNPFKDDNRKDLKINLVSVT